MFRSSITVVRTDSSEPAEVWAEVVRYHLTGWLVKHLIRTQQPHLLHWSFCFPFTYNNAILLPKKTLQNAPSRLARGTFWVAEVTLVLARSNHTDRYLFSRLGQSSQSKKKIISQVIFCQKVKLPKLISFLQLSMEVLYQQHSKTNTPVPSLHTYTHSHAVNWQI